MKWTNYMQLLQWLQKYKSSIKYNILITEVIIIITNDRTLD